MPQSPKLIQFGVVRLIRRVLISIICFIILVMLIYNCYFCPRKVSYKVGAVDKTREEFRITASEEFRITESQDFLINTPGCYIPNYAKTYKYDSLEVVPSSKNICGVRYIFIDIVGDDKIKFRMDKFTDEEERCCYRFARESPIPGHEHDHLSFTPCEIFTNNTIMWLEQEVITVTCTYMNNITIYKDTYIILKKIDETKTTIEQSETKDKSIQWNVLMIGLDGMSRTRLFDTMPQTTQYLKKHKWLDFKAYQKVGESTFQNLMSVLTGKRVPIYWNCTSDLDKCADFFIWKKYKYDGYKTAHGESNLLTETLYKRFRKSPTDHFMRPLLHTITSYVNEILCLGKEPSATHLLNYAHKFVDSYKTNTFFGFFWINTYNSYNDIPQLSDTDIVNFFRTLNGVLNNTFIIFFSDQGTSFGTKRYPAESYYDNRLPMLFVWTPLQFRRHYTNKNYNLNVNQERLITPYDVYITLADILKLSMNSSEEIRSEACPQCTSLFEKVSPNRTCIDAGVGKTWCSCHNLLPVTTDDYRFQDSILAAVAHIKNIRNSIKTVPCTSCTKLKFPTILRAHEYYEGEKTYHVMAFYMSPNKLVFEVVVVHYGGSTKVLTVRSLTRYNDRGNCALHGQDRPFCVCVVNNSCFPGQKTYSNFFEFIRYKFL